MTRRSVIIPALALSLSALALGAAAPEPLAAKPLPPAPTWPELGVETQLYVGINGISLFGSNGNIRTFEPDNDRGLWIQDHKRRWYYATTLGPCQGLNFAQAIGFDNRGSAYFDKFARLYVGRDICALASFVTAEKPPTRKERRQMEKTRRAAEKAAREAQRPAAD